ncbi:MAG: TonB-dependent receptor [Acidobacteria bacterium]|nr:TonB-dependent receptor [Acidobacteriota bacterium]
MTRSLFRRLTITAALLAMPVVGYAQEAVLIGTVVDSTGGVLPGVTVRAIHQASGNSFEGVTDERGAFRIAVRTGSFQVTAVLSGFTTVTRAVDLLVGQQAALNITMSPSGVAESVTVTGEVPLVEFTQSTLGGNIDPQQMESLPVQGRNWMQLTMLAPGSRVNAVGDQPTPGSGNSRNFAVHLDGQEVSQTQCCRGQPEISRDAIAEFQFLSSRFDATQGRSMGVQVNVITKSGTNSPAGSFAGYFRDAKLRARDFFTGTRVPYENQQLSATFGGPILRDKLHYFANYEYQREPRTVTFRTPYPAFNLNLTGTNTQWTGGVRTDYQISSQIRLMTRVYGFEENRPYEAVTGAATTHPAASERLVRNSQNVLGSLTQVLSSRSLNELKVGYQSFHYDTLNNTVWANHPQAFNGLTRGSPRITFTSFSIGGNIQAPQDTTEAKISIRDDLSISFNARGRHDVKVGGEWLRIRQDSGNCRNCMGLIDATGGPTPANIEQLFPVWDDASTWNLAAISNITRSYTLGVGKFNYFFTRNIPNAWVQDDWMITSRLTLNLGVRYELILNTWMNEVEIQPFLPGDRPDEKNNIAPRLGFAYKLNDLTVVRGGVGQYFGYPTHQIMGNTLGDKYVANVQILNDGRRDFAANPFNGPIPSFEALEQLFCSTRNVPGCQRRGGLTQLAPPPDHSGIPYSWQSSVGFERQLGTLASVSADYVFVGQRRERDDTVNINLAYNPATGVNYPFNDIARRPFPEWGTITQSVFAGESNYNALEASFTKRMANRWQASATYTLGYSRSRDAMPMSGTTRVTFPLALGLGGEYGPAAQEQRHRAVFSGIWDVGYGFQLSGLYFFGSGERFPTSYGGDRRNLGIGGQNRLRPDGSIVPRNNFVGKPIHRVDMRLQRRFQFGARVGVDGIVEVYNLFNHRNYGSYTTVESNAAYGRPSPNQNVAYTQRMLQLGFRTTF